MPAAATVILKKKTNSANIHDIHIVYTFFYSLFSIVETDAASKYVRYFILTTTVAIKQLSNDAQN